MMKKLIIPAELKICATCSYWDGERRVDSELGLVVVAEDCQGECLVCSQPSLALSGQSQSPDCLWEDLATEQPATEA